MEGNRTPEIREVPENYNRSAAYVVAHDVAWGKDPLIALKEVKQLFPDPPGLTKRELNKVGVEILVNAAGIAVVEHMTPNKGTEGKLFTDRALIKIFQEALFRGFPMDSNAEKRALNAGIRFQKELHKVTPVFNRVNPIA